jgi:hypothetical protein
MPEARGQLSSVTRLRDGGGRAPHASSICGSVSFGGLKPRPIRRNCSSSVLTAREGISVTLTAPLKIPVTIRGLPSGSECIIGVCPARSSVSDTYPSYSGHQWPSPYGRAER